MTVAMCPDCGRWLLVEGPAPATCLLTTGCPGLPVKIIPANQGELPIIEESRLVDDRPGRHAIRHAPDGP